MQTIFRPRIDILLSLPAICLIALVALTNAVAAQGLPDYAVESIVTSPSPGQEGRSIVFIATVRNISSVRGTQRGNAVLKIDQGNDGIWDRMSTRSIYGSLSVGTSTNPSWGNTGVPPPIDWQPVVGTHRAQVCIHIPTGESSMYFSDSNSLNDCKEVTFTIAPNPWATTSSLSSSLRSSSASLPDLIVSNMSVALTSERKLNVSVTVKNQGGGTTHNDPYTVVQYRINNEGAWINTYPMLAVTPLNQGQEDTRSFAAFGMVDGGAFPVGNHMIRACTDVWGSMPESDETNNCAGYFVARIGTSAVSSASSRISSLSSRISSFSSRISSVSSRVSSMSSVRASTPSTSALPDYEITAMSVTPDDASGKFNAWATVKNIGSDSVAASYIILEHRRLGATGWEDIVPARNIAPLRNGQEAEGRWTNHGRGMYGSYTFGPGTYEFRACADAWNLMTELDESNCHPPVRVIFGGNASSSLSSRSSASSRTSFSSSSVRSSSVHSRTSRSSTSRWRSSRSSRRSSSSDIADTSLPNLVLRAVTVTPASITMNGTWGVRAKVMNTGATPSRETLVRLTLDELGDGSENYVSDIEMAIPSLQPGRQFTVTWSSRDPSGHLAWQTVPGRHRVTLCVNERRQSLEWNYDDNCEHKTLSVRDGASSASFTAVPPVDQYSSSSRTSASSRSEIRSSSQFSSRLASRPDYSLSNITIHPLSVTTDSQLSIVAVITNSGATARETTVASLQIDEGNDEGADYTEQTPVSVLLESGERMFAQWSMNNRTLQWPSRPGTHRVVICVNPSGTTFPEMDITDNCIEKIFSVARGSGNSSSRSSVQSSRSSAQSSQLPDLRVNSMNVQWVRDGKVSLTASVQNRFADIDVPSEAIVQYSLNGTGPWITSGEAAYVPPLAPGQFAPVVWGAVSQADGHAFTVGRHKLRVCADAGEDIRESSERNNCGQTSFDVPAF